MDSRKTKRRLKFAVWAVLLIFCSIGGCRLMIPRQEWSKKWGPLVPHTSFPGDCSLCHVPERWDKMRDDFAFDHEKETGYPLVGAHAQAACLRCHNDRGPVEAYVARGCAGCHQDPHAASLGMDCQRCHSQFDWQPIGLVGEHARTRFPLVGSHAVADCESCHQGAAAGRFQGAPLQCEACHSDDLAQALDPDHVANGWVTDCQRCHTPVVWQGGIVPHDFFPLVGGHGGLNCTQCHSGGTFTGLTPDCFACHQSDYQGAPDHATQNYAQDCTQCHTISGWTPAAVDHSFFPLTAGHGGLSCTECHIGGTFTGLSQDCYSCHQPDYQGAPGHVAQNFSMNCTQCHDTTSWDSATVDHSFFPLTAGHSGLSCSECHVGGTYSGLSQDCYACHQSDYQGAPDHATLGFSQDCTGCHSISAWRPSSFNHSFPLQGNHDASCITCHDSGSTAVFTCFNCHEHRKSEADSEHSGVSGYTYSSPACYSCHPNGRD